MVQLTSSAFSAVVLSAAVLVSASPASQKPPSKSCTPLTLEQAETLPGWPKLKAAAEKNWGASKYNLATNPPDYPKQTAKACGGVAEGWVWFNYETVINGHYKWALHMDPILNAAERKLAAAKIPVGPREDLSDVEYDNVRRTITSDRPPHASAPAQAPPSGASCKPLTVAEAQKLPGWPKLKAEAEKKWGTSKYNLATNPVEYPKQTAKTCKGIAQGWVWFNYEKVIDGHYKWAIDMDQILNTAERKSVATHSLAAFNTSMTSAAAHPTEASCGKPEKKPVSEHKPHKPAHKPAAPSSTVPSSVNAAPKSAAPYSVNHNSTVPDSAAHSSAAHTESSTPKPVTATNSAVPTAASAPKSSAPKVSAILP